MQLPSQAYLASDSPGRPRSSAILQLWLSIARQRTFFLGKPCYRLFCATNGTRRAVPVEPLYNSDLHCSERSLAAITDVLAHAMALVPCWQSPHCTAHMLWYHTFRLVFLVAKFTLVFICRWLPINRLNKLLSVFWFIIIVKACLCIRQKNEEHLIRPITVFISVSFNCF